MADFIEMRVAHGAGVIRRILDAGMWDADRDYRLFYNVNFPPLPAAAVKYRYRIAFQGKPPGEFTRSTMALT